MRLLYYFFYCYEILLNFFIISKGIKYSEVGYKIKYGFVFCFYNFLIFLNMRVFKSMLLILFFFIINKYDYWLFMLS